MGDDLTLEKLKIDERLREVELHMAEAKPVREEIAKSLVRMEKTLESVDGKLDSHEKRIAHIEESEEGRKKTVDNIMKVAWGALTMAIGAAVMWIFKVLKFAFLGH